MISPSPTSLLYHKVTPRWEVGITWVIPGTFRRQMEEITAAGWQTILPDQINGKSTLQQLSPHSHESGNQFMLFFDDGYECIYRHAFPVLEEIGFKACVFIPSGYVGRQNDWDHHLFGRRFRHLNKSMLKDLADAGWMIGSHCVTHCNLLALNDDRLKHEIHVSRQTLQDLAGRDVRWISFPFGRYDQRCIDMVADAGYSGAITPVLRPVSFPDNFNLILVKPVYLWHGRKSIHQYLENGGSILDEKTCLLINGLNYGTVLWKSLLHRLKPLKT